MKQPYSVSTAAKTLGFTTRYVYELIYSGRLRATKNDLGEWNIDPAAVASRLRLRKLRKEIEPQADLAAATP